MQSGTDDEDQCSERQLQHQYLSVCARETEGVCKGCNLKEPYYRETYMSLPTRGAAISEKTASLLGLKVGDMIP